MAWSDEVSLEAKNSHSLNQTHKEFSACCANFMSASGRKRLISNTGQSVDWNIKPCIFSPGSTGQIDSLRWAWLVM